VSNPIRTPLAARTGSLLLAAGLAMAVAGCLHGGSAADAYLLAGQSNMSGRGSMEALTADERTPDPAIRLYGNDGKWRVALDPLDDATGQVDAVSVDPRAGVGPGFPFAREMRRLRRRSVALIPCAKGGSSLDRWRPRGGRDTLYGSCLARARDSGAAVTGILWYQGETDAQAPGAAERWRSEFVILVAHLRHDLGKPLAPVVFVQLADRPELGGGEQRYPSWRAIQAVQAESLASCTATVSAAGLPMNEDGLHLSTAGQRRLGRELARAMTRLLIQGCR
jgi:hypothetical protein